MNFIWFCLISYGLTQLLVYGKIFDPLRPQSGKLGQLLRCPMCTGFWVGLFLWFVKDYTQLFTFDDSFITGILLGAAASAAAAHAQVLILSTSQYDSLRLILTHYDSLLLIIIHQPRLGQRMLKSYYSVRLSMTCDDSL